MDEDQETAEDTENVFHEVESIDSEYYETPWRHLRKVCEEAGLDVTQVTDINVNSDRYDDSEGDTYDSSDLECDGDRYRFVYIGCAPVRNGNPAYSHDVHGTMTNIAVARWLNDFREYGPRWLADTFRIDDSIRVGRDYDDLDGSLQEHYRDWCREQIDWGSEFSAYDGEGYTVTCDVAETETRSVRHFFAYWRE